MPCGAVVERLWRTEKSEEAYLRAYASVSETHASVDRYPRFYNGTRPHSSHGGQTADQAYLKQLTPIPAAAQPKRRSSWRLPRSCSDETSRLIWAR